MNACGHPALSSTNRRALRMATAITDACGLTPGGVRQQRGVVDVDVPGAVHPSEAVGGASAEILAHRCGRTEMHRHDARIVRRERRRHGCEVTSRADDRGASERRVDLERVGLEHQQCEAGQPTSEQVAVTPGEAIGDDRIAQAGHCLHPSTPLAGDRGVVDDQFRPGGDGVAELAPVVGECERDETGVARRSAERDLGSELLDLDDRDVARGVDLAVEPGGELHGGVDGERPSDAVTQPRALQHRRRLDGSAAHDDVAETDGHGSLAVDRRGQLRAQRRGVVHDDVVETMLGQQARAGSNRPRKVGLGHALAASVSGASTLGIRHPAGDLVVLPTERLGTPAQDVAGRRLLAGHGLDTQCDLDLVADRLEVVGGEVDDAVVRSPAIEGVPGRSAVQPTVDLGAAAGATPLGVGDRREPEGHGDPAGPVLLVHLLQRERCDRPLRDPGALLDDQDVVAGFGERGGGRRAPRTRSDDEHVAVVVAFGSHGVLPSTAVAGHFSHTYV